MDHKHGSLPAQQFEIQTHAIQFLGATQPRISDLMRGKINLFGLGTLVNMATAAGLRIELRVTESG